MENVIRAMCLLFLRLFLSVIKREMTLVCRSLWIYCSESQIKTWERYLWPISYLYWVESDARSEVTFFDLSSKWHDKVCTFRFAENALDFQSIYSSFLTNFYVSWINIEEKYKRKNVRSTQRLLTVGKKTANIFLHSTTFRTCSYMRST